MLVFDIKRYAINDGPGIRCTVFFKGCPLRCVWCHNPESWAPQPELLFKQKKCIGCNTCGLYPNELGLPMTELLRTYSAEDLAAKAEACPPLALEMAGKEYSLDELLAEIEKERDIMTESGGGVTLSGGEPLMQQQSATQGILVPLLKTLGQRGLHRVVDTTLNAFPEVVRAVAACTDLFLVDLKVMDSESHRRLTGVGNERILANIRLLDELGADFIIRIPLIEGINADEANIEDAAIFLSTLCWPRREVNLLPYHAMGRDKHTRRRTTYNPDALPLAVPSDETLQRCINQFAAHGIKATIGG